VAEREFTPPTPAKTRRFAALLSEHGANVTIRRSLGADVDAACGQLRRAVDNV